MGFETQEEAERWAEGVEFAADARRKENLLASVKRPENCQMDECNYPLCSCKVAA